MPTAKSKFNVALFVIIAIAAVILAGGLLGLQQQTSINAKLKDDLQVKNAQKQDIEAQLRMEPQRIRERNALKSQLSTLDGVLVDYTYIPTYLTQLQKTAKDTGNTLRVIAPLEPRPFDPTGSPIVKGKAGKPSPRGDKSASGYWTMQINLTVESDYVSVLKFLDALRTFPKLVYVRTVSLQPAGRDGSNRVTANIETYAIITPSQYLTPEAAKKLVPVKGTAKPDAPKAVREQEGADENE